MPQPLQNITALRETLNNAESIKLTQLASQPGVVLKDEAQLTLMRQHLLEHYQGVESQHSFVDSNGSVFDCIPVAQQPALRGKAAPPTAPDIPHASAGTPAHLESADAVRLLPVGARDVKQATSFVQAGGQDTHGNAVQVPDGTIPVRRVTIEEMARFQTLQHFFAKNPLGAEAVPGASGSVPATHRWAHGTQNVANLGGHSRINIWQPTIGPGQVFSLSQHWYVGSSAAGATQTVEVGLQVYPAKYNRAQPTFFIYWTADNYNKTGCYNLDCSAFVQTNKNWAIGGAVGPNSVYGGAQYELEIAAYLSGGHWWIYVNGTAGSNAIGYYPASQYGTGSLATHANLIDYGGEVVGTNTFPGMGSSHFAAEGWTKACFQRQVQYYPQGGGTVDASLSPQQAWPKCYTAIVSKYNPAWSETLWYGGPGGIC